MRSTLLFSFLAALPWAALAQADAEPEGFMFVEDEKTGLFRRQHSTGACPHNGIHIVAAPGAGGTGPEDYGYLNTTIKAIQRAIPGSNNFCLGPYQGENGLYQSENAQHQARAHITAFHKRCPNAPIAIVGYSTGAIGAMNLLCGSSPAPPWKETSIMKKKPYNVFAMATFGDETRKAYMPYNAGTCANRKRHPHTGHPWQAPKYPRTSSQGCKKFFHNIRAWCDKRDGDCCNAPGAIDGGPAHFRYPLKYNGQVVKFIKERLHVYRKNHQHHHHKHPHKKHHKKHHHHKHPHKKHHHKKQTLVSDLQHGMWGQN